MGTRILQEDEEKIVIELTVPKHSKAAQIFFCKRV